LIIIATLARFSAGSAAAIIPVAVHVQIVELVERLLMTDRQPREYTV
jgi:hypothetical protein